MKLSEFSAGVSVGKIRIGADAAGVRKILGDEESSYPTPGEFSGSVDDEHFLCWRSKGIEVGFDAIDDSGQPTEKSRVVAIHVRGPEVTDANGNSVSRAVIQKLRGLPDETGDYTASGGKRRTWEYYIKGLQAVYDSDGWLVSLCVSKPKVKK